jgi:type II secretory pathway pseudopilin PulG
MLLRPAQSNNARLVQLAGNWRTSAHGGAGGFSLIELLLVVGLVLMLASAMVFNFSSIARGNELEQGTTQLETLMRFARAQAANSGRKVQLVFGGESTNAPAATTGEVRATWEPDPLGQPGLFADLGEAHWHVQQINDLVQVESVKVTDATGVGPMSNPCPEDEEADDESEMVPAAKPMSPITFYPDGSSDSAEIVLASRSFEEEKRMAVRLVGITGSISHQLLGADLEEPTPDGAIDRSMGMRRENSLREARPERDTPAKLQSTRPAAERSALPLPKAPRAPVGETNRVDLAE